jgi:hypothetical protein
LGARQGDQEGTEARAMVWTALPAKAGRVTPRYCAIIGVWAES